MLNSYFGITVNFNEGLERWVATDNLEQETIGYGETSLEALFDYLNQKSTGTTGLLEE